MIVVGYAFEEAIASIRRAGRSAVVSVITIAIAFVTLGGFLLLSVNVQGMLDRWLEAAEMSVYLNDNATEEERAALESALRARPEVAGVEYVGKERALERFRADFPELADVADSVDGNPFPAVLEVRLRSERGGDAAIEALARELGDRAGVADVQYDRRWLARLMAVVGAARWAAALVAGLLMLGAAFTVGAVVRLSLHSRRDEIEIMALVGAPFSYIRGPFIMEGLLLGGVGALVALVAVGVLYYVISGSIGTDLAGLSTDGQLRFLGFSEIVMMLVGGLLVGAAAGTLASRAAK